MKYAWLVIQPRHGDEDRVGVQRLFKGEDYREVAEQMNEAVKLIGAENTISITTNSNQEGKLIPSHTYLGEYEPALMWLTFACTKEGLNLYVEQLEPRGE